MPKILNMDSKSKKKEDDFIKELAEVQKIKSKEKKQTVVIDLSWRLSLFIVLGLAVVFWGKQLVTVGMFLFVALVIMSALRPIINWFVSKKVGRGWAITITYILGLLIFGGLLSAVFIPLVGEFESLVEALPGWVNTFVNDFNGVSFGDYTVDLSMLNTMVNDFFANFDLQNSFESLAGTVGSVFGWGTLLLASVIFSIYLILDHDSLLEIGLIRISSDQKRKRVKKLVLDVENKLGSWLLGQAAVSGIAGLVLGVCLALLGVPFALPLAVFAALMDPIPNIGATLATIPAVLIALVVNGPIAAIIVLIIYIVYQQIENNVVIPKVMGDAVGVKPILIMLAAMSFLILFGIWGAILAVPVLVVMQIVYEFYIDLQKLKAKGSI